MHLIAFGAHAHVPRRQDSPHRTFLGRVSLLPQPVGEIPET
jgi:hypothetical protein